VCVSSAFCIFGVTSDGTNRQRYPVPRRRIRTRLFFRRRSGSYGKAALFLPIGSTTNTVSFSATDIGIVKTGGQIQVAQFHLSYRLQSGLAYRVYQNKWIELWGLAAPGFVANGVNLQAAFQYGAAVGIKTGKSGTGPEILLPLAADTVVATKFNPAVMVAFRF